MKVICSRLEVSNSDRLLDPFMCIALNLNVDKTNLITFVACVQICTLLIHEKHASPKQLYPVICVFISESVINNLNW